MNATPNNDWVFVLIFWAIVAPMLLVLVILGLL